VLIGRWNWWPSALSRARPAGDPSGDPDASFTTYKLLLKLASGNSLARFGSMRLAVPAKSLRWRPSALIHGLESLPVRLVP